MIISLKDYAKNYAGQCDKCPMHINYIDYEDNPKEIDYCAARVDLTTKPIKATFLMGPKADQCPLKELLNNQSNK